MYAAAIVSALFAAGALAKPSHGIHRRGGDDTCLTLSQATTVAQTWAGLIAHYSQAVADEALVIDFVDYSESVNSLINGCPQGAAAVALPLLNPTFSNRTQFEIGQSQQPPLTFDILKVFPGCGSVSFRWMTNDTAPIPNPAPVVGIITIETQKNTNATSPYEFLIDTVYSEFDAAEWIDNLKAAGICPTTACSATATATPTASSSVANSASGSTITPAPKLTTSTSTAANGDVYIYVTETDDVYVTETDYVTVTAA